MRKVIPLPKLSEIDNIKSSRVDAVLMGTAFGGTRLETEYELDDIIKANDKIDVIANYNRFYFEPELEKLTAELKQLSAGGIKEILCTDMAVIEIIRELDLNFKIIYNSDTTMANAMDVSLMLENGVDEVVVAREITLKERLDLQKQVKGNLGMHFFGYPLMSFSRRKHLSQYASQFNLDLDSQEIHYLRELKRDEKYMIFEDAYGTHIFAPKVMSAIHAYHDIKRTGYKTLYFDTLGLELEDVLFVIRNLDLAEDAVGFEKIVKETMDVAIDSGLLYVETEKGK